MIVNLPKVLSCVVTVKYELLSHYCVCYGLFGHKTMDCSKFADDGGITSFERELKEIQGRYKRRNIGYDDLVFSKL